MGQHRRREVETRLPAWTSHTEHKEFFCSPRGRMSELGSSRRTPLKGILGDTRLKDSYSRRCDSRIH